MTAQSHRDIVSISLSSCRALDHPLLHVCYLWVQFHLIRQRLFAEQRAVSVEWENFPKTRSSWPRLIVQSPPPKENLILRYDWLHYALQPLLSANRDLGLRHDLVKSRRSIFSDPEFSNIPSTITSPSNSRIGPVSL